MCLQANLAAAEGTGLKRAAPSKEAHVAPGAFQESWGHLRLPTEVGAGLGMSPEPDQWLGHTIVRITSETSGWALFCLGQGAGSQEPCLLYSTTDGGRTWTPELIGRWLFEAPAPEAPQGPGGYPVALDAWADTAWVAVYSPAGGHLEVVRVTMGDSGHFLCGCENRLAGYQRQPAQRDGHTAQRRWRKVLDGLSRQN